MPSMKPAMLVIGVFSSCETLAIKERRTVSCWAKLSAMLLKAIASLPISSRSLTGTRTLKSPRAKASVAFAISRSGRVRLPDTM